MLIPSLYFEQLWQGSSGLINSNSLGNLKILECGCNPALHLICNKEKFGFNYMYWLVLLYMLFSYECVFQYC